MADEEGEVRRMAEIADAINAILESEPSVGDTPAQEAAPTPEQAPELETGANSPADTLDAAIAAEFATDGELASPPQVTPADDPFGPAPNLDLPGKIDTNMAIGQDVRVGSDMANLSLRMQDTLSEIRHQANEAWQGADDLLAEMEKARASLVADVRGQIQTIASETQKRRQTIMQELEQLESQSLMARDEMEVMLVKFETSLTELHSRYFHNAESERERLARYREFLQFMLDERGL